MLTREEKIDKLAQGEDEAILRCYGGLVSNNRWGGTYYDEQGLKHYNDIMELKGKMSQQEIAYTLGISKTIVNKMCCKTYKPHISNARYFSDIIRDADWFEQI